MTTGEGGMLVTDRDDIRDRVLFLRDHGRMPGDVNFQNQEVAYKYRMSSMQAALGLAQVERAEELVARKREIFDLYANELANVDGISLNAEPAGVRNSYWMTTLICDPALGLSGKQIQRRLKEDRIDSRPFFHPLSSLPAYSSSPAATVARNQNSFAYSLSPLGLNLPSGMDLTFEQIQRVCRSLQSILQGGSNDLQDVA